MTLLSFSNFLKTSSCCKYEEFFLEASMGMKSETKNSLNQKSAQKKADTSSEAGKSQSGSKRILDFTIAGVPYRLKTSHDEATAQDLVEFVKSKIDEALPITKNGSFQNAAVLAAMNIAEELLLLKKKAAKEFSRIEEKTSQLINELEELKSNKADKT